MFFSLFSYVIRILLDTFVWHLLLPVFASAVIIFSCHFGWLVIDFYLLLI